MKKRPRRTTKRPSISVVMTTLNSARFVAEAVESILGQTFRDFELVAVDGGSDDDTVSILQKFKDRRIRVIVKKGLRRSAQLNRAVEKSRADIIAIMDSDDIALPNRLAVQYEFLDAHRDIGLVGSWAILTDEHGEAIGRLRRPESHESIARHIMAMNAPSFPTICWRKEIFRLARFNERLGAPHDVDWYLRLLPSVRFANIPEPLMRLRQTQRSLTRPFRRVQDLELIRSVEATVEKRLQNTRRRDERADAFRSAGIAHYYYGSPISAKKYLWESARLKPIDALTLRYLAPLVTVPSSLFSRLRESPALRNAAGFFRMLAVRHSMRSGKGS